MVSTLGVMDKEVALEFKKRYPGLSEAYGRISHAKKLDVGKLLLWKSADKWVLIFSTKKYWRTR